MSERALDHADDHREALRHLTAGYRPLPGVRDELMDEAGAIRPHWQPLLAALAGAGPQERARRFEIAERQLRAAGVSYRVYGDAPGERPWPLSHMPLVISAQDWRAISRGVVQRARLAEALLADVYGPQQLVSEGVLPAALVAGNREFFRPLVGVRPAGGRFLHIYAADLARGPDGRWWVLADRAQAPSGPGYAVENRLALSRAFPNLYRSLEVDRLGDFFHALRAGLAQSAQRGDPRVCLLTPGALNETYFEHAYLARFLGLLLVEGGDLSVHDGTVYIRTVEGPQRADVILRRLDADFADPLELNHASRLGVPGLAEAVRRGGVVLGNALGSGFIEARAMLGFMPALARRLLGEELELPTLATWWCGQEAARKSVMEQLDSLILAPAFAATVPGLLDEGAVAGRDLSAASRARLADMLESRGLDLVAQEDVALATTPVWEGEALVPRPFALRVFVAAGPDGYTVMPGGLCRIAPTDEPGALSMQRGGRSADVWVLAGPRRAESRPVLAGEEEVRRGVGPLPSRAADHLFWFGRYLERAEATLRAVRAMVARMIDEPQAAAAPDSPVERLAQTLQLWGAVPFGVQGTGAVVRATLSGTAPGSVKALVSRAREAASVVRDRLSPDAWRALVTLDSALADDAAPAGDAESFDRADRALRTLAAVSGLAHENMNRLSSWRFLELGQRIERAIATSRFARQLGFDEAAPLLALDMLLELADSQVAYRTRYFAGLSRAPVLDLVVLDPANPRSVAFQLGQITDHLAAVSRHRPHAPLDDSHRLALKLETELRIASAYELAEADILGTEQNLMALSDAVTRRYLAERAPDPAEGLAG